MPEDNERDRMTEQEQMELDSEMSDELDARVTGEELVDELEDEQGPETSGRAVTVTPRELPVIKSVQAPMPPPVTVAVGKVGDTLWGEQKPERPKSELDDLFEVPEEDDNDMYIDDLFEVDDEEVDLEDDLSDLTTVTDEDIMGAKPKPKVKHYRRTDRQYNSPSSMGGVSG